MKKDLNYYLNLRYKIELNPIPEDKGGGYEATIPQLGRYAFVGRGKTPEEALAQLEKIKKDYFDDYLKEGIEIPEPEPTSCLECNKKKQPRQKKGYWTRIVWEDENIGTEKF